MYVLQFLSLGRTQSCPTTVLLLQVVAVARLPYGIAFMQTQSGTMLSNDFCPQLAESLQDRLDPVYKTEPVRHVTMLPLTFCSHAANSTTAS